MPEFSRTTRPDLLELISALTELVEGFYGCTIQDARRKGEATDQEVQIVTRAHAILSKEKSA